MKFTRVSLSCIQIQDNAHPFQLQLQACTDINVGSPCMLDLNPPISAHVGRVCEQSLTNWMSKSDHG